MDFEILETNRLILKGLTPVHMKYVFENYTKKEIKILLGHRSEEDYQKEEYKFKNGYASYNRSFMLFLLTDKGSNKIFGRCGLHNWNKEHSRAEIGYSIDIEQFKRKGLMSEALEVIIAYGFDKLKLNRIEALVGKDNIPSLKLMEKYDFMHEGILRNHYYLNDKYIDSIMFSILRKDYYFIINNLSE